LLVALSAVIFAGAVTAVTRLHHRETAVHDTAEDVEIVEQTSVEVLEEDTLVEDVSIDGMCGVY
jgi:mycofactocin precursor